MRGERRRGEYEQSDRQRDRQCLLDTLINKKERERRTGNQNGDSTVVQLAEQIADRWRMTGQNVIERGQPKADDHTEGIDADHHFVSEVQTARHDRTGNADEQKAADQMRPNVVSF